MTRKKRNQENEGWTEGKTKWRTDKDVDVIDENTIYIKGVGTVSQVGELDVEKFIEVVMSVPSFWR